MIEVRFAKKYLLPKKGRFSSALLSFISVLVISLICWLVVVFFSVTRGIENQWVDKLTTLHGPLKLYPMQVHSQLRQIPLASYEIDADIDTILSTLPQMGVKVTHQSRYEIAAALVKVESRKTSQILSQVCLLQSVPDDASHLTKLVKTGDAIETTPFLADGFFSVSLFLPKVFQDQGIDLGDRGVLIQSTLEQNEAKTEVPFRVAGFYDPGMIQIGPRTLLANQEVVRTFSIDGFASIDPTLQKGVQIWCDLKDVDTVSKKINEELGKLSLNAKWKLVSYKEYDFAKQLVSQFESDRVVLSIIAVLLMIVASTNITSSLLLLVHQKREEIAILRTLGATKTQILSIFGLCGVVVGCLGGVLGLCLGALTINNINTLLDIIAKLQGRPLLQEMFYGKSLPSIVDPSSIYFVLIATPLIALCAGLIPALRATKVDPVEILKGN